MEYTLYKEIGKGHDPVMTVWYIQRHSEEKPLANGNGLDSLVDNFLKTDSPVLFPRDVLTTIPAPTSRVADGCIKEPLTPQELVRFQDTYFKKRGNQTNP